MQTFAPFGAKKNFVFFSKGGWASADKRGSGGLFFAPQKKKYRGCGSTFPLIMGKFQDSDMWSK